MAVKHSSFILLFILLITILFPTRLFAEWAYSFVVWDGYTYVITDEYVEEVNKMIGHVTKYSDVEGTYYGNFSNTYKKGTKYYSIKGISTDEAIAVKEDDGKFKKATRQGEYPGKKGPIFGLDFHTLVFGVMAAILLVYGLYFIEKRVAK